MRMNHPRIQDPLAICDLGTFERRVLAHARCCFLILSCVNRTVFENGSLQCLVVDFANGSRGIPSGRDGIYGPVYGLVKSGSCLWGNVMVASREESAFRSVSYKFVEYESVTAYHAGQDSIPLTSSATDR